MITTELWNGQGLGNQLACYITTRCIALDKGYEFGIAHPERFKGTSFLKLDFGGPCNNNLPYYIEKTQSHSNGCNISTYDPELINIPDDTKIGGIMQGENYFKRHKNEIQKWLNIEPIKMPNNQCIINFRGGEYVGISDLFLTKKYWDDAINNMTKIKSDMIFHVVTDDINTARKFFPGHINITHDLNNDYRSIQSASYLILSNSSFAFFPAWLNKNLKFCIAPRYWARHNISDGYWSTDQNYTEGWYYQDRSGNLDTKKNI